MLQEMLLEDHSKQQKDNIVAWIGSDEKRFNQLVHLFLQGNARLTQRAGWPLSDIAIAQPNLVKKHLQALLQNLQKPGLHNAVKRNTVRLLQFVTIPKKLQGYALNLCFGFIEDPKEAVAVKAFSLTVLQNFGKLYPDILPEIKLIIEARWPHETAAFRSRARKMLQ